MYDIVFLAAGNWSETFNRLFADGETTFKNGGKAAGVLAILIALVMGRMLVKVLSAILLVGVALYGMFNIASIEDKTTKQIEGADESMRVIEAPAPLDLSDLGVRPAA